MAEWKPLENKYPGYCRHCRERVEAGEGYARKEGDRWTVVHKECDSAHQK